MQAMYAHELPYPRQRGSPLGCMREAVSASDTHRVGEVRRRSSQGPDHTARSVPA
jgi:hypothetical protein